MGQRQTAEQIADWASKQAAPANKPKYDRLTRSDLGVLLKLHKDGLSQVEIAQRLGCSQGTVSKWLSQFTDTIEPAKAYLRGQALRMAKNIVQTGRAREHVQALTGLGVLQEQQQSGFTLVVNGFSLHGTGPGAGVGQTLEGEVLSPPLALSQGEGQ